MGPTSINHSGSSSPGLMLWLLKSCCASLGASGTFLERLNVGVLVGVVLEVIPL